MQVILNGSKLPVKNFQDYVNLYLSPGTQRVYEKLGDRWEVCISLAEQGQFQQVYLRHITVYALPLRICTLLTFCRPRLDSCKPKRTSVLLLQVSFVNSICTVKGGTHVDLIANQICK